MSFAWTSLEHSVNKKSHSVSETVHIQGLSAQFVKHDTEGQEDDRYPHQVDQNRQCPDCNNCGYDDEQG